MFADKLRELAEQHRDNELWPIKRKMTVLGICEEVAATGRMSTEFLYEPPIDSEEALARCAEFYKKEFGLELKQVTDKELSNRPFIVISWENK